MIEFVSAEQTPLIVAYHTKQVLCLHISAHRYNWVFSNCVVNHSFLKTNLFFCTLYDGLYLFYVSCPDHLLYASQ